MIELGSDIVSTWETFRAGKHTVRLQISNPNFDQLTRMLAISGSYPTVHDRLEAIQLSLSLVTDWSGVRGKFSGDGLGRLIETFPKLLLPLQDACLSRFDLKDSDDEESLEDEEKNSPLTSPESSPEEATSSPVASSKDTIGSPVWVG